MPNLENHMPEKSNTAMTAADLLAISPVVPVVVIKDAEQAVPLARVSVKSSETVRWSGVL